MTVDKKEILKFYQDSQLKTKLYTKIKLRICPLIEAESYFPKKGKFIDLGSGNGLFPLILKLGSSERDIMGFDLDEKKINIAQELTKNFSQMEFHIGDILTMNYPPADIFSFIDVLYLIPYDAQEHILQRCRGALNRDGWLFIKEMDRRPRWKYLWNYFQETLAVKIIGFTIGERFYFRSQENFRKILANLGFAVEAVRLDKGYWYPHILYLCQKQ